MGPQHFHQWSGQSSFTKQFLVLGYCHNSHFQHIFCSASRDPHSLLSLSFSNQLNCELSWLSAFVSNDPAFRLLIALSSAHHHRRHCSEPSMPASLLELIADVSSEPQPVERPLRLHQAIARSCLFLHKLHFSFSSSSFSSILFLPLLSQQISSTVSTCTQSPQTSTSALCHF